MRWACREFGGSFRFLVVYIAEAHASDEWPVGARTSVTTQPTTLAHRMRLASRVHTELLGQDEGLTVVCDDMSNSFQTVMAAWPIRFYVVEPESGELLYKAQPDLRPEVYGYSLETVTDWLRAHAAA